MGKGVALLSLIAGLVIGGSVLGFIPPSYSLIHAPRGVLIVASALLVFTSLILLARDHRGSDLLSALALLALSILIGWMTFYGAHDVLGDRLDWIPEAVRDSFGQLMYGLGMVACGLTAFFGLRRLLG